MKTTTICSLLLAIASTATAQLHESERTLNLKGLKPLFAHARGKVLLLGVTTNQAPDLLTVIKPAPTPIKKRDQSDRRRKFQVLFGRDLLGFAEISLPSMPTAHKASKLKSVDFVLTFDSEEQAAKAAEALRLPEVTPKPIPGGKEKK